MLKMNWKIMMIWMMMEINDDLSIIRSINSQTLSHIYYYYLFCIWIISRINQYIYSQYYIQSKGKELSQSRFCNLLYGITLLTLTFLVMTFIYSSYLYGVWLYCKDFFFNFNLPLLSQ